jgi:hypothetical protein
VTQTKIFIFANYFLLVRGIYPIISWRYRILLHYLFLYGPDPFHIGIGLKSCIAIKLTWDCYTTGSNLVQKILKNARAKIKNNINNN